MLHPLDVSQNLTQLEFGVEDLLLILLGIRVFILICVTLC
jgi:hypothetical protein